MRQVIEMYLSQERPLVKTIAQRLGMDVKTVRKILKRELSAEVYEQEQLLRRRRHQRQREQYQRRWMAPEERERFDKAFYEEYGDEDIPFEPPEKL